MREEKEKMKKINKEIIKSVIYSDTEFFNAIRDLYKIERIDLDPTYSKGNFYKEIQKPLYRFDIEPKSKDVQKADCRDLGFNNDELESIVFDPPFLFRNRPSKNNDKNCGRFAYFKSFQELLWMYKNSLNEFYRILKRGGYLFFKCQDMTDNRFYYTHCEVKDMAIDVGFKVEDLFILVAKNRIWHSENKQRHARKFHSYWWVFKK